MSRFQQVAGTPLSKVGQLRAAAIFLVAGLLALVLPQVGGHYIHGLVSLMTFCCIAPAWYEWQAGRLDVFETVHVIGLLYLLYFGFGALWALNDPGQAAFDIYLEPFLPRAALYCLLGYVALLGGYFGPWFRGDARRRSWAEHPRGALFVLLPGVLGLMGGLAGAAWTYGRWLGASFPVILSSLSQFSPLFLFSWALCWILVLSGRATRAQKWAAWGFFVPGAVALALATLTDKSLAMTLAGIPLLSLWYAKRKIPWKSLLILLLLLVFVVFPFYNTFRVLDPRIPWKGRVAVTAEIIRGWDVEQYLDQSVSAVKRRLALANSVAVVIRDVPRWVPYAQGQTLFLPTMAFFIPRVLWPDKPAFTMGRTFAETFRVVHILDQDTRIAVTVPGELYWNFDLPGIVIGMALWGLALRLLYRRYGESRFRDPVRHAIHIVLLIQFVHFGGGLAAQSVIVLRTLIMLEILRWLGRRAGLLEVAPVAGSGAGANEQAAPSRAALSQ